MSETVRKVNEFFRTARKSDIGKLIEDVIFSERQERIFTMRYIKGYDITFIGDALGASPDTINKELKKIRKKLLPVLVG